MRRATATHRRSRNGKPAKSTAMSFQDETATPTTRPETGRQGGMRTGSRALFPALRPKEYAAASHSHGETTMGQLKRRDILKAGAIGAAAAGLGFPGILRAQQKEIVMLGL